MGFAGVPINLVIVGLICYARRQEEIGGWLLFFYIQLYLGLAVSILLVPFYIANFLPSSWHDTGHYIAFLAISLAAWAIYVTQFVVAHKLRRSRDAVYLGPLRRVLALNLGMSIVILFLDITYSSLNIFASSLMVIWAMVWWPYFYRSVRVGHVFVTKDWSRVAALVVD